MNDPTLGGSHEEAPRDAEFAILVVCTANRCRSPVAQHLLQRLLRTTVAARATGAGPRFSVASAGVRAVEGLAMDPFAAAELLRLGGDSGRFRTRRLTVADLDADLVLTATLEHRREVLTERPAALRRTFTLLEFAHLVTHVPSVRAHRGSPRALVRTASDARSAATLEEYDIVDPVGRPVKVHRRVADAVAGAVREVAAALTGD